MKIIRNLVTLSLLTVLIGCATGSSIVTGIQRAPISSTDVKIYLEPPSDYEIIGLVEASSEVEFSSQAAQNRTVEELKKQAAKIGANGVILLSSGERSSSTAGFISGGFFYADTEETKTAKGKAIYVK